MREYRWSLNPEPLDLLGRKELGWLYSLNTFRRNNPDNEHWHDVKHFVLACSRGERGARHINNCGYDARIRVVLFGVHSANGGLGIAIVKGDETLYLLLRVADEAGCDLKIVSTGRQVVGTGWQCE